MIASIKLITIIFALCTVFINANQDDNDENAIDSKRMSETDASKFLEIYRRLMGGKDEELREDNNELGEKRAEAFEAYEEKCEPTFHLGKRACPAISTCGPSFNNYDPKVSTTTAKGWFKPKY